MVKLLGSLRSLKPIRVLVVGDFVVDTYVMGKVKRISPEAPVPVLHAESKTSMPGMAGNVALNLISLGASVEVAGRIGDDVEGHFLKNYLKKESIGSDGLMVQEGYQTPVKFRMIAGSQQLIRIDYEATSSLDELTKEKILSFIESIIHRIDIITLSDYLKGLFDVELIEAIMKLARQYQLEVIVDPKGDDFKKYRGASLIKPNLSEAYIAAKCSQEIALNKVAEILLEDSFAKYLFITRSEHGISIFTKEKKAFLHERSENIFREDFPVRIQEVKDVTGAGDTVLSVVTMAIGNGLTIKEAALLSNIAASIAIQKLGCVRVSLADIAERLLQMDTQSKIFDEDHLFALKQVLSDKRFAILGLEVAQDMSTQLFQAIRLIKAEKPEHPLIIYLKETKHNEAFISLLASLHEIDFVILESQSLSELCARMPPYKTLLFRENIVMEIPNTQEFLDVVTLSNIG